MTGSDPERLPVTLHPSPAKAFMQMAACAAFVVIALLLGLWDEIWTYLCIVLFGYGAVASAIKLLPHVAFLTLAADRFTYRSLFRSTTFHWHDIVAFSVYHSGSGSFVGWTFQPHHPGKGRWRALTKALTGVDACLPDTYGMKAQELADLMNRLRQRSG